ncbi:hypothetical protein HMPREF0061_0048, partial [Aerococcus viridans ATCC 11563 = CCUG 4311]
IHSSKIMCFRTGYIRKKAVIKIICLFKGRLTPWKNRLKIFTITSLNPLPRSP